jgi:hypothetical protein
VVKYQNTITYSHTADLSKGGQRYQQIRTVDAFGRYPVHMTIVFFRRMNILRLRTGVAKPDGPTTAPTKISLSLLLLLAVCEQTHYFIYGSEI